MGRREEIEAAVRAGLLPREQGKQLIRQTEGVTTSPSRSLQIEEGKIEAQEVGAPPQPATPETIVVRDDSADWRKVAAILSAIVSILTFLKNCL